MNWTLEDTFTKELPADPEKRNFRRQVTDACFSYVEPRKPSRPSLMHVSKDMLRTLGLTEAYAQSVDFLGIFSGALQLPKSRPFAMCYGGHQFGQWAGQLGDGRAINLAEVVLNDQRWALQLKGAGETPYSRNADGLAVLRSSIREHLCSEAMFHLGVPTTRSLSLILTGDEVLRDMLYDGNATYEKGAVVCRVAPSFIRFGNFQILAARKDLKSLRLLANYTIRHFFPNIEQDTKQGVIDLFREVSMLTLEMVIHWQRVGFVHGVMNTDNMSILGLTIDYGPYGWLEGYDPNWTPNTTDRGTKRYRFGHQAQVALWNLAQLASALYPLVEETEHFQSTLEIFQSHYVSQYVDMMRQKIGLSIKKEDDQQLISTLESNLQLTEVDMTIFFRQLNTIEQCQEPTDAESFLQSLYKPEEMTGTIKNSWAQWFKDYRRRLSIEPYPLDERAQMMQLVNPKYVLRNYMAQMAIDKADKGDYSLINELYTLLQQPYAEQAEYEHWFSTRPEWARVKVGCSMLSCSS